MIDKYEYQGYWWIPDEPDNKVPGILRYDPDEGASLNLFGSLTEVVGLGGAMINPKLILGISSNGKYITLVNCGQTGLEDTLFGPGFPTSTFQCDAVLVGEHFENPNDIGFEKLIVEYLHLDAWADVSGFKLAYSNDTRTDPLMVMHTRPEPFTATVGDDYEVTLSFPATAKKSAHQVREARITQRAELAIKHPERKPFDDLDKIAFRLQHLLSFGTRRSVYPVAMWGVTGYGGEAKRVAINYRSIGKRGSDEKRPSPDKMLFRLRDLPSGFGPAVERWLERAEILDPVYRLYLATIYNPESYIEQKFINFVQALEVYHRRVISSPELPAADHASRMEEILEAVPDRHRDWLKGKLEFSNEPNLRKRLREILDKYPESADFVVGDKKQRGSFINKVLATRNYRTHFDESRGDQAVRGEELYPITQKLQLLIEVCLLGEIGFEAERIRELIG